MVNNSGTSESLDLIRKIECSQETYSLDDSIITLPFDVFYQDPNEQLTLTIKNKAPSTNPPIRITKLSCTWNYVDILGNPSKTETNEFSPNTLPGQNATVNANKGECVRTFSLQITVGIPELNEYRLLPQVSVPDVSACIIAVNYGVGTSNLQELADKLFGEFITPQPLLFTACTINVYNKLPTAWNTYIFGNCGFIFTDGTDETDSQPDAKVYSGGTLTFRSKQTSKCVVKYLLRLFVQIPGEPQPRGPIDKLVEGSRPGECIAFDEFSLDPRRTFSPSELQVMNSTAYFSLQPLTKSK